jgi:hypothetical protein
MSNIKPDLRWKNMSLMEFLRQSTMRYDVAYPDVPSSKREKELTEKQLFNKLKKELKEVSVKLN